MKTVLLMITIESLSVPTRRLGYLSITKTSPANYFVSYLVTSSSVPVIIDINNIQCDVKNKVIVLYDSHIDIKKASSGESKQYPPTSYTLLIENRQQLQNFLAVYQECLNIMNFSLELISRLRDIYFSGVYSQLDKLSKLDELKVASSQKHTATLSSPHFSTEKFFMENKFLQEINGLCQEKIEIFLQYLRSNGDGVATDLVVTTPAHFSHANCIISNQEMLTCFYCRKEKENIPSRSLVGDEEEIQVYLHPYVPRSFQKEHIMMCSSCIDNWKEYRDAVIYEQQLILPGEVNEEICALCSDTPDTLTLCSFCTRSYCGGCLKKVMSTHEYNDMTAACNTDIPWQCMACHNKLSPQPLNLRSTWKLIKSPACLTTGAPTPSVLPAGESDGRNVVEDIEEKALPVPIAVAATSGGEEKVLLDSKKLARNIQHNTSNSLIQKRRSFSSSQSSTTPSVTENSTKSSSVSDTKVETRRKGNGNGNVNEKAALAKLSESADPPITKTIKAIGKIEAVSDSTSIKGKGNSTVANGNDNGNAIVGAVSDEAFYFAQYTHYIDALQQQLTQHLQITDTADTTSAGANVSKARKLSRGHTHASMSTTDCTMHHKISFLASIPTDDACYLCKDGGDVIECDWKEAITSVGSKKASYRCYKVYHDYCLNFGVDDSIKTWLCPRHFCSICGSKELAFMCQYCPVSLCKACPEKFVNSVSIIVTRFLYWDCDFVIFITVWIEKICGVTRSIVCRIQYTA